MPADRRRAIARNGPVLLVALLPGCGDDRAAPRGRAVSLPPVAVPSSQQCGGNAAASRERPARPPPSGRYHYRTRGETTLIGARERRERLPPVTEVVVTPARRVGGALCFGLQRRYDRDLGDTATVVIRGRTTYLRALRFQAGGYVSTIVPTPAVLTLTRADVTWGGEFRGETSGRYASAIVGRKRIRVGTEQVAAVGVRSRTTYRGETSGWERALRWIAPSRNLVVAERITQQRSVGLDRLRLDYAARLEALEPS